MCGHIRIAHWCVAALPFIFYDHSFVTMKRTNTYLCICQSSKPMTILVNNIHYF